MTLPAAAEEVEERRIKRTIIINNEYDSLVPDISTHESLKQCVWSKLLGVAVVDMQYREIVFFVGCLCYPVKVICQCIYRLVLLSCCNEDDDNKNKP